MANSLRDEVKDSIKARLLYCDIYPDQLDEPFAEDMVNEIACDIADSLFSLLMINETDQDANFEEWINKTFHP
jgi:hypothetical protein